MLHYIPFIFCIIYITLSNYDLTFIEIFYKASFIKILNIIYDNLSLFMLHYYPSFIYHYLIFDIAIKLIIKI